MSNFEESDYLVVKLGVTNEGKFEEDMPKVFGIFKQKYGWRLLTAAKAARAATGDRETKQTEYLHIWQTPSPIELWNIMIELGRNSAYQALHEFVAAEEQDIFRLAEYSPDPPAPLDPKDQPLLVETLQVKPAMTDPFVIEDWKAGMAEAVHALPKDRPMQLTYALQSQTGPLRRFVNLWKSTGRDGGDLVTKQRQLFEGATFKRCHQTTATRARGSNAEEYPSVKYQDVLNVPEHAVYKTVQYATR